MRWSRGTFVGVAFASAALALAVAPAAEAALIGPTAYTGFAGSPFDGVSFSSFSLEDFEDGALNTPGVSASAGGVLTSGSLRDSVESTPNGYSYYTFGVSSLTFTFSGTLPTHAGIVWTDVGCLVGEACPPVGLGKGNVFFEAFDSGNGSLGVIGPSLLGDGAANGGTAEDRFFGASNASGISKLVIWMPESNDWEVDHLQYGVQSVPEPGVALLFALGSLVLAVSRPQLGRGRRVFVQRAFFALLLGSATLGFAAGPASALGLTGQSLSAAYYYPDLATVYGVTWTPSSFTVGAGQETDGNVEDVTHLLVDFADDSLTITLDTILSNPDPTWNNTSHNGPVFTSALSHGIASASVDGSTTMTGFDDTRVSFTGNQILVNWAGLSYEDGTVVKINFTFVPEPASAALLLVAGLALVRRARF
jgi:hypothetical protein